VSVLLHVMKHGAGLRVRGEVSPALLDGLETLQAIWQRWRPRRYRQVSIIADREEPATSALSDEGVFAFSGGVDATFSLFRHLHGTVGRNGRKPGAALLVHGMDIPLDRLDFFEGAARRADRILRNTGVPLIPLRTNARQLRQDWEDAFGLLLSGCFLLLQSGYRHSIRGSGEPYDTLLLPWGATPLTDRLASTEAQEHIHDGAEFDRTEKVRWLAEHTAVTGDLRVCWAGPELDRNCGECEKCVRTMLNFWAVGREIPPAFPTPLTAPRVRSLRPKNEVQLRELRSILQHAFRHHNESDQIYLALRRVLRGASVRQYRYRASELIYRSFQLR
jgi:hypothetical protein